MATFGIAMAAIIIGSLLLMAVLYGVLRLIGLLLLGVLRLIGLLLLGTLRLLEHAAVGLGHLLLACAHAAREAVWRLSHRHRHRHA